MDQLLSILSKPVVPSFEQVHMAAVQLGGTKEQAEAFYNKWEAVEWYKVNPTQPIRNFKPLLVSFIQNWRSNDKQRSQTIDYRSSF